MAHDDMDEEELEEKKARRPAGPRFGPFVTIAVAILMLFGAASRLGKTPEQGSWLNFDILASRSLEQDRLRQLEQRNTTLITLGVVPSHFEDAPPQSMRLRENVLPPERNVDFDAYQDNQRRHYGIPAPLSLPVPTEGNHHPGASESSPRFDPVPEMRPNDGMESHGGTYVVAQGDNWVKIGKRVGKQWKDIQSANPQASEGLRVGMKLIIP